MPVFQQRITVHFEDGTSWTTEADQRDLADFEIQPFYKREALHTSVRFMAWHAGRRDGQTKLDWPAFNRVCVEADSGDDQEDRDLDPTSPATPAGN